MSNVEKIIEEFDFKTVHKIMTIMDWTYDSCTQSPTVEILKETARGILNDVVQNKYESGSVSTGGFRARKGHFGLTLEFIAVEGFDGEF